MVANAAEFALSRLVSNPASVVNTARPKGSGRLRFRGNGAQRVAGQATGA